MSSHSSKFYHLDKLENFMSQDQAAVKHMVDLFLQTTPELLASINKGLIEKDATLLAKSAHTLKPTLDIFGIDAMHDPIRQIEKSGKENNITDSTVQLVSELNQILDQVFTGLRTEFEL